MFNAKARREAINQLERAIKRHNRARIQVLNASEQLLQQRQRVVSKVIQPVEDYVNRLANTPKEFDKAVADFRVEVDRFDGVAQGIQADAARHTKIGNSAGAAGAVAGVGIAALGPSAAMAVATTFGTASTGTAISALSGAAATNAALAWLGGGAIAAGGGGMAAGSTLLALAGPVGWTIGGAALVGSGLYLNSRNKKHAQEATERTVEIEAATLSLSTVKREIEGFSSLTKRYSDGCLDELVWLTEYDGSGIRNLKLIWSRIKGENPNEDYRNFNSQQKERLAALINNVRSLSALINKEVAL